MTIPQAIAQASAHWNAGQADQAEILCQKVLAVWPGQPDALHLLGLMAHAFGNLSLAIQHLRQACLSPRAPALYFANLTEMSRQQGLLAEAEEAGRRAVSLQPDLISGWNNLGITLQEAGKLRESAACLERVLMLSPNSADTYNNLGNTYTRMGELEKARRHYAQALRLNPDYAVAQSNLAYLLNELGDYDDAAQAARRAIDLNPQLSDAYINLAGIEMARLRYAEALGSVTALFTFAPDHPAGLIALARILKRVDKTPEALEAARRAVAAAPHSSEALIALGEVLQAMNQHQAAFEAFEAAAGLPRTCPEVPFVNIAILHMETGETDKARASFEKALSINPNNVSALTNGTELKRFTSGDPEIARMEALLTQEQQLGLNDRLALRFALGKAYLDVGDGARAFAHLHLGNRMKRETFSFDIEKTGSWMAELATAFDADLLDRFRDVGCSSQAPIFVVGMPRSGTTLIEQILASHPDVHGAGELAFLETISGTLQPYPSCLADLPPARFAEMGALYAERVAALSHGRRHVVDKMPANFLHVGLIRLILPHARIVHCTRDPADTCLSCYTKLFAAEQRFTYDLTELGTFHRYYQRLTAHWRTIVPNSHFIEVNYEALIENQERETRLLLDALGLAFDEQCLSFHQTVRPVRTASMQQVRKPLFKTSAGRWRAYADHLQPLIKALDGTV
ncbi:tetratricopeptide repeat-containing sulfotransferase family protein [Aquabacter spiritensis]|uniref:Tetratricopeptide (TPR) repeat protein n=1 Tax=Aquabacter spiritensis TaxID=933073 RepID=A0A4R3M624_9HYPH|nr:tetratricopeptide repeat-containing sulfotransferase family protein [Aquabacter spiritensis]TCT07709.1 tetratricopeptide (TPR) repeat protein [Aquabacter spiritensis]